MKNMFGNSNFLNREGSLIPSDFRVTVVLDMQSSVRLGLILFFFIMLAVALGSAIGKRV